MAYKILIVDDERALCEMIRAFLAQAGYATATAGSCAEALTVFRAEQPDAVLLDVMLPDGDGFSLFGQLRALRAKIERDPSHPEHLLTVRGLGYRLAREDGR